MANNMVVNWYISICLRKLPRKVDSLEVELSGTISREGGSNEAIAIYRAENSRDFEGS